MQPSKIEVFCDNLIYLGDSSWIAGNVLKTDMYGDSYGVLLVFDGREFLNSLDNGELAEALKPYEEIVSNATSLTVRYRFDPEDIRHGMLRMDLNTFSPCYSDETTEQVLAQLVEELEKHRTTSVPV